MNRLELLGLIIYCAVPCIIIALVHFTNRNDVNDYQEYIEIKLKNEQN